jgi:hypothetical protein
MGGKTGRTDSGNAVNHDYKTPGDDINLSRLRVNMPRMWRYSPIVVNLSHVRIRTSLGRIDEELQLELSN